jgi:hypothetical protein
MKGSENQVKAAASIITTNTRAFRYSLLALLKFAKADEFVELLFSKRCFCSSVRTTFFFTLPVEVTGSGPVCAAKIRGVL